MHTHLVTFQVVGRARFNIAAYMAAAPSGPTESAASIPPRSRRGRMLPTDPTERGFKDTVKANPGEVTIIRAKFDLPAGVTEPQKYVHHCHIVEHEDNDMMRRSPSPRNARPPHPKPRAARPGRPSPEDHHARQ